jgi:hypothetical protein
MTGPEIRETVTVAGRAERARVARAFAVGVLGPGHRLAETVQQNRLGMASLAVPVFSAGRTMVAAIAVIAPAETNLAATEEPLRACAHAVARAVEIYDHRWYEE